MIQIACGSKEYNFILRNGSVVLIFVYFRKWGASVRGWLLSTGEMSPGGSCPSGKCPVANVSGDFVSVASVLEPSIRMTINKQIAKAIFSLCLE